MLSRLSRKVILALVMVGLICVSGPKGYAQTADEMEIIIAFQDAMNAVLYPQEFLLFELSNSEIKENLAPEAHKIIANTIQLIRERSGKDIKVVDVLGTLPPELEEGLGGNMDELVMEVRDILKNAE